MDSENSFVLGERYLAYVNSTNEKEMLRDYVTCEYVMGNLPIKPNDTRPKNILDLGCGTGANLGWLMELFKGHNVEGIDRSKAQISQITIPGAPVMHVAFEDHRKGNYDFILASHVLQYIDTPGIEFIGKVREALTTNGEAWFIQQRVIGMYEIIGHTRRYVENSRLKHWLSFEDYVLMLRSAGIPHARKALRTSFEGVNFKNPTPQDKRRLEFILCLPHDFD